MTTTRLPAAERRQAIVQAALRVFTTGSYSGATTAWIAREAGISEPILYRHFASKRELYFACLEEAWGSLRAALDAKLEEFGDREAVTAIGQASREFHASGGIKPVTLWIQALTEAGGRVGVDAFMAGFERALLVGAIIAFAGSIVAFALVRQESHGEAGSHEVAEVAA